MDTNFLTTKQSTKYTKKLKKMPHRRAVNPLKDLFE